MDATLEFYMQGRRHDEIKRFALWRLMLHSLHYVIWACRTLHPAGQSKAKRRTAFGFVHSIFVRRARHYKKNKIDLRMR